jgi:hypothetical protein
MIFKRIEKIKEIEDRIFISKSIEFYIHSAPTQFVNICA